MRTERVIYIFGSSSEDIGGFTLYPVYNLIKLTGTKDVAKWIEYLYSRVERYHDMNDGTKDLLIAVWGSGVGCWQIFGSTGFDISKIGKA